VANATTEQPTGFSQNELMTLGELAEIFRFKTARSAERAALANGIRVFQLTGMRWSDAVAAGR
jgi:hypothetical protein